mmetsp:Transcript_29768/g.68893  ORF Transcript_29768/g.68893 Transcript_29768/m.68893 type:complete len:100 (+) Transcript_29768:3-302(+)
MMDNAVCSGCLKSIHSSTGCICDDFAGSWVSENDLAPSDKARAAAMPCGPPPLVKGDDGGEITCKCGALRERASMDPTRVLPCDKCGDECGDAISLLKK